MDHGELTRIQSYYGVKVPSRQLVMRQSLDEMVIEAGRSGEAIAMEGQGERPVFFATSQSRARLYCALRRQIARFEIAIPEMQSAAKQLGIAIAGLGPIMEQANARIDRYNLKLKRRSTRPRARRRNGRLCGV